MKPDKDSLTEAWSVNRGIEGWPVYRSNVKNETLGQILLMLEGGTMDRSVEVKGFRQPRKGLGHLAPDFFRHEAYRPRSSSGHSEPTHCG